MDKQIAPQWLNWALHENISLGTNAFSEVGGRVLVSRENKINNMIGEWLWPYSGIGVETNLKTIYVFIKKPMSQQKLLVLHKSKITFLQRMLYRTSMSTWKMLSSALWMTKMFP